MGSPRRVPVIGEALLHPVAMGSVLLLLLNDHWLKARFPGFLAGKLSDLAGLVFFPLLLWTLLDAAHRVVNGRSGLTHRALIACMALTGSTFLLVKVTDPGAEAFRVVWALLQWPTRAIRAQQAVPIGRVRLVEDATDLIALPMLLVAYWVGLQVMRRA